MPNPTGRTDAKLVAAVALSAAGIDPAPASWTPETVTAVLDVARVLTDLADAAAVLAEKRAGDALWTHPGKD